MASTTTVLGLTKPAYTDDSDISDINGNMDIIDAEAAKVRGNVAADYDSAQTYAVGDYCIHDGDLYKCSTTISSPEAWTAGHWTQIKIAGELTALNGKFITENFTATLESNSAVSPYSAYTVKNVAKTNYSIISAVCTSHNSSNTVLINTNGTTHLQIYGTREEQISVTVIYAKN